MADDRFRWHHEVEDVDTIKGMNVVFTTTAKTDEEAAALLELLGMPFEK